MIIKEGQCLPGANALSISLGGYTVLTSVGTAYDAIEQSRALGFALIDFKDATFITFMIGYNKIGTGTLTWQLWDATDSVECRGLGAEIHYNHLHFWRSGYIRWRLDKTYQGQM
jgi:hypothetical protein